MTEKQLVKYDVTEAAISEMRNIYMDLTVADVEDEAGFAEVELGRKVVKGKRVATEKQRKAYNIEAQVHIKGVNGRAKEIFALLEPIETHLTEQGDIVRNEIARVKAEKEAAEKKKIQDRVDAFLKVSVSMDFFDVASMEDAEYESALGKAEREYEDEQERLKIEAEKKAEDEAAAKVAQEKAEAFIEAEKVRLEKWDAEQKSREIEARAAQEKVRLEQEIKAAELKATQDKIDAAEKARQDAIDRKALEKRLAEEAEARAQKEVQDEADRLAQEKVEAEAEAERQETLKPDKGKLIALAQFLQEGIKYPELKSKEANIIRAIIAKQIYDLGEELLQDIEGL